MFMINIWSLTILIFLLIFLIFLKLVFELVCLKNNCKIKFQINNIYSLKNVNIKFKNKQIEIIINKLWLSSSYLNRSINRPITLCLNDIEIKYKTPTTTTAGASNNIKTQSPASSNSSSNLLINQLDSIDLDQIFSSNLLTILKLLSINIDNLFIELNNENIKIECKKVEIDVEKEAKLMLKFNNLNAYFNNFDINIYFNKILFYILYNDYYKQKFYSATKFKLLAIQLYVQNPVCKFNKNFSFNNYLIKEPVLNDKLDLSDGRSSSKNYNLFLYQIFMTKLILFKIDKFNINILNDNNLVHNLIINEIKYLIPSIFNEINEFEFQLYQKQQQQQQQQLQQHQSKFLITNESIKFSIKNIVYVNQNQTQNLLLNKFILTLNSFKNINLSGYCDLANLYVNLDLIKIFIDYLSYKLYFMNKNIFFNNSIITAAAAVASSSSISTATTNENIYLNFKQLLKKQIFIEFKILNSTLNIQKDENLNKKLTLYSFGMKKCFIKYSRIRTQFSNETNIDLSINYFILYKSLNSNINLFDKLILLNTNKTHYLDTILSVNLLEFKFHMQKYKYNFDLFIDNLHFEYNLNDLVKLRKIIQVYESLFDNIMFYLSIRNLRTNKFNSISSSSSTNGNSNNTKLSAGSKFKFKIMLKTLNFYLIYRNNICIYFEILDGYFNNDNFKDIYLKDTKNIDSDVINDSNNRNLNEDDTFINTTINHANKTVNDGDGETKFSSFNLYIKKIKCLKFMLEAASTVNDSVGATTIDDLKQSSKYIQLINYAKSSQCNQLLLINIINFRNYKENTNFISNDTVKIKKDIVYNRLYLNIQDISVTWSLNTHFMLFEAYKKISQLSNLSKIYYDKFKMFFSYSKSKVNNPVVFKFNVVLESDASFNIYVDYGQDSSMKSQLKQVISIVPSNVYFFVTQNGIKTSASAIVVCIDDVKFVKIQNFVATYLKKDTTLHLERKSLNTDVELNRLLFLKFDSVLIKFAYDYNYAKLIDHLLNYKKFFKVLHSPNNCDIRDNKIKQPMPLPCDLIVKINKFRFEIEDDPFEVKLAYNYALMLDEYHESVKRRQKLDERQLIKDRHLENEAYEILKEREAYVYMQRSKKMYEKPIRTQLFTWSASDVDMHAIVDTKWNGTENCIKMMKKIDKVSSLPANVKYLILWCRHVNLNIKSTKLLFRDYAQPLLQINEFHIWGYLLTCEIEPAYCAIRDIILTLDESKMKYKVQRSISPLKFYHDFCSKTQFLSVAYGPCKEGSMAQFNLALDKIIHPPRNPSMPLPWWDKTRLYLHGRLTASVEQMQWIYHVSMDPYNRTEEMKWSWSNLYLDWTNMRIFFAGSLQIFLNTASKYDDCRILYWPNLEMLVKLEWLCKQGANPNDHNFVMPSMTDKVPVENLRTYDAYAFFRSENLNLRLTFNSMPEFLKDDSRSNQTTSMPVMKFYASTLRFLQRIKGMFASVTRPTRRGKIFLNFKPRKPLLSRHLKFVHFQFHMPKFDIIYWSSASEQYGFQIECSSFSIDSTQKLDLVDPGDKLIRRFIASWSIELMELKTSQTFIYLKSPSKEYKSSLTSNSSSSALSSSDFGYDNEFSTVMENERSIKFLDSAPVIRNFLLQVDFFSYKREPKNDKKAAISQTLKSETKNIRKLPQFLKKGTKLHHSNSDTSAIKNTIETLQTNSTVKQEPPLHKIQIVNLKGKWNNINRDVVYTLYDIYHKAKVLRHNLSSLALKQIMLQENSQILLENYFHHEINESNRNYKSSITEPNEVRKNKSDNGFIRRSETLNETQFKGSYADEMLQKLESERGINSDVYTNDAVDGAANFNDLLYGVHAATKMNDISNENIHIEFINCQIKLNLQSFPETATMQAKNNSTNEAKLNENSTKLNNVDDISEIGYLIISAAKADVIQRLHQPVWKHRRLLDKVTWHGHLECMQYFATLKPIDTQIDTSPLINRSDFEEYWLSRDVIDPSNLNKGSKVDKNDRFFDMYCKNTLGMIISPSFDSQKNIKCDDERNSPNISNCSHSEKLQLIVSKCRCEFFMIDFNDKIITEENKNVQEKSLNLKTFSNLQSDLNSTFKEPFDCFTLIHDELNLSTNPSQFQMILEIVNNLVLYFRPKKKQVVDRQKSLKFNLQLFGDISSLKEYIMQKQIEIKEILSKLRVLERQIFYLTQKIELETENLSLHSKQQQGYSLQELKMEHINMEKDYKELKKLLNVLSDELSVSINCFKEVMLEQRIMCLKKTSFFKINKKDDRKSLNNDAGSIEENESLLDSTENSKFIYQRHSNSSLNNNLFKEASNTDNQLDLVNEIGRRYEIWFKHTQWKLTEPDGVNECAQFTMKNFLYTKVANQQELDCVEHTLEVESCKIQDLTPDQSVENDVLTAQFDYTLDDEEIEENYSSRKSATILPENKVVMLRIFCKQRPPVNYISVIEHLELNVAPIRIRLTNRFYKMMMKFFFEMEDIKKRIPKNNASKSIKGNNEHFDMQSPLSISNRRLNEINVSDYNIQYSDQMKMQFLLTNGESIINDDIEIMKKRSANNNTFICIKIPEIPLLVSYKGNKENNIKDLTNVRLLFPLFEAYNKTWTWLDLINAIKTHLKKALVSQAIKHKLIKIPIKPVNNLIRRTKNSNRNIKMEDNEKNTLLKLIGTKLIEKRSNSPTVSLEESSIIHQSQQSNNENASYL